MTEEEIRGLVERHKSDLRSKGYATGRLDRAIQYCERSGDFDQEEIDHLREILRIIMKNVPQNYFCGFEHFKGARNDEASQ
jgi:hypothetical protein